MPETSKKSTQWISLPIEMDTKTFAERFKSFLSAFEARGFSLSNVHVVQVDEEKITYTATVSDGSTLSGELIKSGKGFVSHIDLGLPNDDTNMSMVVALGAKLKHLCQTKHF